MRGDEDRIECTATCTEILLAIFLPPLAVFLKFGCKIPFWICLLLTLCFYIPGSIYALNAVNEFKLNCGFRDCCLSACEE